MMFRAAKWAAALAAASATLLTSCLPEVHYLERDVRDDVFYFVMPDRFENGDISNDFGGLTGDAYVHGFDPTNKGMYHGGDMAGLESRLDYLKDMGITAIWMTPILKNQAVQGSAEAFSSAYHGYWTLDFTQIDPHLGTNDDLKSLIDAAHERNMKVYFDIITNHTADVIKYEECHEADGSGNGEPCTYVSLEEKAAGNGLTPFIPAGLENAKVPAWLNDPKYYNNQGDSTFSGENSVYGDFVGLDDLDTTQQEVIDGMIAIYSDLVSEFKPDGFRIDTVKHVNIEFWQQFSPALIEHAKAEGIPKFFMFGEVYDGNPQVLSQFTTTGKLQSVLDFGIQGATSSVIAGSGSSWDLNNLFAQDDVYSDADSDATTLMNFAGNHDMGRIGMFIQNNNPDASDEELLARAKLANALMFFARGVPVIYYGDEQGFTGDGNDQDAREDMFASQVDIYNDNNLIGTHASTADDNFDATHPLYQAIADYSIIYKSHEALRYGVHVNRYAEDGGLYAFSRVDEDNTEYLVVFNAETEARTLTLEASSKYYLSLTSNETLKANRDGNIALEIDALDFAIYRAVSSAKTSPKSNFTIVGAQNGAAVAGRVELTLDIEKPLSALPTYTATFEASVEGDDFTEIAVDRTAPYRLFWQTGAYADGTEVIVRATLDNGRGQTTEQEIQLVIDSRVPQSVSVDYENSNLRDLLFVADHNGGIQGPIAIENGQFSFNWDESDASQLLVFVNKTEDVFAIDAPVQISRSQIVALSDEDSEGQLQANLFLNNLGEFAKDDNDVGGYPIELPLDANAEAPFGDDLNVRGGLNGWATDAMTYVGNQTYKAALVVDKGESEFKYADSNWSPVNIGGQLSENGLVQGSNPGNLTHNFAGKALYNFYLVASELNDEPVILHFIEQEVGPVGETLYVKGSMNGWSNDNALAYVGDNRYETQIALAAGQYEFKLANSNWSWERVISDGVADLGNAEAVVTSGANITLNAEQAANYSFTYLYDDSLTVSSDYVSDAEPGLKLVFKKPAGWADSVNLYFWEAASQTTDWPGVAMTDLGDGYFGFELSEGNPSANVIFNDGNGNQTANLTRSGQGCYVDEAWLAACAPYLADNALTITFEKPADWDVANIYYWEANGPAPAVAWPGVAMTSLGVGNWVQFEFPEGVSAANIIFNNGAGSQTQNLYREGDGCYLINENTWVDACNIPEPQITVYFQAPADWAAPVNIYHWNSAPQAAVAWPGVAMNELGNGWYSWTFAEGVIGADLIFNDGSNQTDNLYRNNSGCYSVDDGWVASCDHP